MLDLKRNGMMKTRSKIKLVTGIGIRPDIIRLSEILKELDKYFDNVTVDTGQHYDYNLNKVMYEQLGVREPNCRLDGKAPNRVTQMGAISKQFADVLYRQEPDMVVILGDNNSSLAMALAAAQLNIPIAHIESGNRSFNWEMPEEKNRTVIDHLSDIHFCYTEDARANLAAEGINRRATWVVGNPIVDVMKVNLDKKGVEVIEAFENVWVSPSHGYGIEENKYILVTCHRSENVGNPETLCDILNQLSAIYDKYNLPVILIEMPRLKQEMARMEVFHYPQGIAAIPPQPYLDFLQLEKYARLIISDSGTVPEVAYAMGKPCIQIREKTERMELLENGSTILVANNQDILTPASCLLEAPPPPEEPIYKTGVAQKIARILLGNAINAWRR